MPSAKDPKGNDNPSLICELEARNWRTSRIWSHPHNAARYQYPSCVGLQVDHRSNGDNLSSEADPESQPDQEPVNRLTFNRLPLDPSRGFVFGSDPKICDVYCGESEKNLKVVNRTFCINLRKDGLVVLEHITHKTNTMVTYGEQGEGTRRIFR